MSITPEQHGIAFDSLVDKCNDWLEKQECKAGNRILNILSGTAMGPYFARVLSVPHSYHPVYSNETLIPSQKDAVLLASDWKRLEKRLGGIIGGEEHYEDMTAYDAAKGIGTALRMYTMYRNEFIHHATDKHSI
jgi:hypothetical protein